ncbi:MAG: efflux transporter outer membrane subunit [Proteobacteria bacterium]|nr:efflux transporter outer membrane subunit [Pseudomonadota bacterium]
MRRAWLVMMVVGLSACSLAPEFSTPEVSVPAAYKQAPSALADPGNAEWKPAEPRDGEARGEWWTRFGDPLLDEYQRRAAGANQDLAAALARLEGSRALVRLARADQLPRLDAGAAAARTRPSANQPGNPVPGSDSYNSLRFGVSAQYELDLFGRVRDSVRAARADAAADESLYQSLLLTVETDVAQRYFALRALDAELAVLNDTVTTREAEVAIFEQRFKAGDIGEFDVERARTELDTARGEVQAVTRQRAQYEHALALLLGEAPANLDVAPAALATHVPSIPAGVPSALLERRPDIAAAQRRMIASNARIGVARAAFYPILNLSADAGFAADTPGDLFKWASRTWALGPLAGALIAAPLFDGGRNQANLAGAEASLDAEIATYRQTVLNAFREVEDGLVALRTLEAQSTSTSAAARSAAHALELANARFQAGATGYIDVLDARRTLISVRRQQKQLDGARATAAVGLVKALGGGW